MPTALRRSSALAIAGGAVAVLLLNLVASFLPPLSLPRWVVLHSLLEGISVIVAALIFAVGAAADSGERLSATRFLALAFLAVALFDGLHLLTYGGMPDVWVENTWHRNLFYWLAARFTSAIALLLLVLRTTWRPWRSRDGTVGFLAVVVLVSLVAWFTSTRDELIPPLFVEGQGLSGLKIGLEYTVVAINLLSILVLLRRAATMHPVDADSLLVALGFMVTSELCFTSFNTAGDLNNVLGHVMKTLAFIVLYNAVFVAVVRAPYRALQKSEAALRQSQKTEAVGRLAGGIAHDFNNLLTAILSSSALLREEVRENPDAIADLDEVEAAAKRGAALTKQLLQFSRQQQWTPAPVELGALVSEFAPVLRRLGGAEVMLEVEPPAAPLVVNGDRSQLEQVVLNLVINARDALTRAGVIRVSTSVVEIPARPAPPAGAPPAGRWAVLTVADNGVGMPVEVQSQIFDPFFTTKPLGQGTGLGLSTVHGIVQQHHGVVMVESQPGVGSTFRVHLPLFS